MKRYFCSFLLTVLFLYGGLVHAQEKRLGSLTAAYASGTTNTTHLWIAKDAGLFEKYGLSVNLVYINGTALSMQALIGGDVDIIYGVGAAAVTAAARGASVVTIATSGPTDYVLMARPTITTIEGLKGKVIGISNFAGSDYFALRRLLPMLGLVPNKDVILLPIGSPNPVEKARVIVQGRIDATLGNPVTVLQYELQGQKFAVLADVIPHGIYVTSGDIITTRSYLKNNPERVKAFLKGFSEGILMAKKEKELAFRALRKYLKIQNQTLLDAIYIAGVIKTLPDGVPYPSDKAVQFAIEDLSGTSPDLAKLKTMNVSDFNDPSYLKELEAEGFFARLGR